MTDRHHVAGDALPLAAWRDASKGRIAVALLPDVYARVDEGAGDRCRDRRRRATPSTASTPASASSPASASPTADLETLQRNIVLSHAAGVGEPMPAAVARLMMALKLASLGQGASGVRRETVASCWKPCSPAA